MTLLGIFDTDTLSAYIQLHLDLSRHPNHYLAILGYDTVDPPAISFTICYALDLSPPFPRRLYLPFRLLSFCPFISHFPYPS